jgi:hypothetical protein
MDRKIWNLYDVLDHKGFRQDNYLRDALKYVTFINQKLCEEVMANTSRKRSEQNADKAKLTGSVVVQEFAKGSKSDHQAVCLRTAKGTFVLRMVGGNPFNDSTLLALVGKNITTHGRINGPYFMMTDFKENE